MTMRALSLSSFLLLPHTCLACGGLFCEPNRPVVQAGEAIAFGVSGPRVEMHVQVLCEGPAEEFSWLLPVPFEPEVGVGSELLFLSLFQTTLPRFRFSVQEDEETCSDQQPLVCPEMAFAEDEDETAGELDDAEEGAIVLQEGSVGPYDFVVIEASDGNPDSIRQWLVDNNYDEYDGSAALLNYYATLDYKFVALRLRKEAETGDIQPVILTQEMPPDMDPDTSPIACVPIKLTAVAANDDMPVQVYILGKSRASPVNYVEMHLDEGQVDWIGCGNNQACHITDLRARFKEGAELTDQLVFHTEYSGSSAVMDDQVAVDVDVEELAASPNPLAFLEALLDANVPSFALMDTIVETYLPRSDVAKIRNDPFCENFADSMYNPQSSWWMSQCLENIDIVFDAPSFAAELQERVFEPAVTAQEFLDEHSVLTRLYAELSPENMIKDPFFAFDPDAPDVSNIHAAQGVVKCSEDNGIAPSIMDITIDDGTMKRVVSHEVFNDCGRWIRANSDPLYSPQLSPIQYFSSSSFAGSAGQVVARSSSTGGGGTFDRADVRALIASLDSRVVTQDVSEFDESRPLATAAGSTNAALKTTGFMGAFILLVASTMAPLLF